MEVDCPNCGERLTTRADNAGKRIHCPLCSDMFMVPLRTKERLPDDPLLAVDSPEVFSPPPQETVAGAPPRTRPAEVAPTGRPGASAPPLTPAEVAGPAPLPIEDDGDTYSLAPGEPAKAASLPPAYQRAVAELDAEEAARQQERDRYKFNPRGDRKPRATQPAPQAARTVLGTPPPLPPGDPSPDEYAIDPIPAPAEPPPGEEPLAYRLAKERLEQEIAEQPDTLEEPPLWPFLSGVVTYPWTRPLLLPWATASGGAVGTLLVFQLAAYTLGLGGRWFIVTVVCCAVAAAASALTGSYLAVYLLSIVENTVAGLDELASAPDTSMMERVKPCGFLVFLMWVATLPGFAVGYLLLRGLFGPFFGVVAPTFFVAFLVFPVMLLSTLEGGSIFQLLSPPIARGLREHGRIWLGFYLSSGGALLGGLGVSYGLFLIPIAGPLFAGPLLVATVFIYARMIGRLSWLLARAESEEDKTE